MPWQFSGVTFQKWRMEIGDDEEEKPLFFISYVDKDKGTGIFLYILDSRSLSTCGVISFAHFDRWPARSNKKEGEITLLWDSSLTGWMLGWIWTKGRLASMTFRLTLTHLSKLVRLIKTKNYTLPLPIESIRLKCFSTYLINK